MSEITQDAVLKSEFYDDEEFDSIFGFDEEEAWNRLRSFTNTTKLVFGAQSQKDLQITLGKNITDEHPWKAIKKETLEQCLGPALQSETKFKDSLDRLKAGSSILIQYLPELSAQEDTFLVYSDVSEINEASEIIRNLELLERLKQKVLTEKRPRQKWSSEGAEEEIARWKRKPEEENVQTEAQSVFPIRRVQQTVSLRSVSCIPDGYVELLPHKWKTVNIPRKITDRETQAQPQAYTRDQQTEPAFPSNAATQYLLDVEECAIDPQLISSNWLQKSADTLSSEAQFNLIEFYRNEYGYISQKSVPTYREPKIREVLSFMNRSLSIGRNVCSMDWHPVWSGILVASYTFDTVSKQATSLTNTSEPFGDVLNRMTFEKCAVLLWSFEQTLEPLLELNTIREVTTISFCPYDEELLVGGLANGQIVLWDLKGELDRVEQAKRTAHESSDYRTQIRQLMDYPPTESFDRGVYPAAVSSLEHSSRSAITCIKWLPRNYYCTSTGQLKESESKLHRFMVTSALDGSMCFWDLDFSMPALQKMIGAAKVSLHADKTLYQRVNNLFFPTYKLICQVPILSVIIDEAFYLSMPLNKSLGLSRCVKHQIEAIPVGCEMRLMLGSFTGQLVEASWEGYDFEQGTLVNDEAVKIMQLLSPIHDGPILALERNPTVRTVFLSIGGHVLAVWSMEQKTSPIFWRKKIARVTACCWSLERVSVFFIGLSNGDFEIWDIIKTYRATVCMNVGAETLTVISQHRLANARSCLAIADQNANIRIFAIAPTFVEPLPNEEIIFRDILSRELQRKENQAAWTKSYYERNMASIEAKNQAELEARDKKLQHELDMKSNHQEEIDATKAKTTQVTDKRIPLGDRLEQKYQAKRYQTLLRQLMARRNVSPERMTREMRPVVERRKYNAEKREAIATSVATAEVDFAAAHRMLRPVEKTDVAVDVMDRTERVDKFQAALANYQRVEAEARKVLLAHYLPKLDSFEEVLKKSKERRDKVNIHVGTNVEHMLGYENKRSARRLGGAPTTLLEDLKPFVEMQEQEEGSQKHE
uniref:WD repeat-containing protein 63 n=1 Tax=Anopheles farauti TaxID=69004 RepID=A0A182QF20_9DIPT